MIVYIVLRELVWVLLGVYLILRAADLENAPGCRCRLFLPLLAAGQCFLQVALDCWGASPW
jgi:hypothetical protein